MCKRAIRKVQDEGIQRIINEETERRPLAAYIHGLKGVVVQLVQFQMPSTMEQAVKLAVTVENAEEHKQMVAGSRKVFANRKETESYSVTNRDIMPEIANSNRVRVTEGKSQGQSYNCGSPNGRNVRVNYERLNNPCGQALQIGAEKCRCLPEGLRPSGPQCFHFQTFGHLRRECPKLTQRNQYPNGQGSI